jgi:hypothetical protein
MGAGITFVVIEILFAIPGIAAALTHYGSLIGGSGE